MFSCEELIKVIKECRKQGVTRAKFQDGTEFLFGEVAHVETSEPVTIDKKYIEELEHRQDEELKLLRQMDEEMNLHISNPTLWEERLTKIEVEDED